MFSLRPIIFQMSNCITSVCDFISFLGNAVGWTEKQLCSQEQTIFRSFAVQTNDIAQANCFFCRKIIMELEVNGREFYLETKSNRNVQIFWWNFVFATELPKKNKELNVAFQFVIPAGRRTVIKRFEYLIRFWRKSFLIGLEHASIIILFTKTLTLRYIGSSL